MRSAGEERGATASTGDRRERMKMKKALRQTLIAFSDDWGYEYVGDNRMRIVKKKESRIMNLSDQRVINILIFLCVLQGVLILGLIAVIFILGA